MPPWSPGLQRGGAPGAGAAGGELIDFYTGTTTPGAMSEFSVDGVRVLPASASRHKALRFWVVAGYGGDHPADWTGASAYGYALGAWSRNATNTISHTLSYHALGSWRTYLDDGMDVGQTTWTVGLLVNAAGSGKFSLEYAPATRTLSWVQLDNSLANDIHPWISALDVSGD